MTSTKSLEKRLAAAAKKANRDREATPMMSAFDFTQAPRAPEPLPMRDDCKGPVYFEP